MPFEWSSPLVFRHVVLEHMVTLEASLRVEITIQDYDSSATD